MCKVSSLQTNVIKKRKKKKKKIQYSPLKCSWNVVVVGCMKCEIKLFQTVPDGVQYLSKCT